jgi:formamidopyrimidine-DNA glycosylase
VLSPKKGLPGRYTDERSASRFAVYDREGKECRRCGTTIERIVQGGRSTFFCPGCQTE